MSTSRPANRNDAGERAELHQKDDITRPVTLQAVNRDNKAACLDRGSPEWSIRMMGGPATTDTTTYSSSHHRPSLSELRIRNTTEKDDQHRSRASNGMALTPGAVSSSPTLATPTATMNATDTNERRVTSTNVPHKEHATANLTAHHHASSLGVESPSIPGAFTASISSSRVGSTSIPGAFNASASRQALSARLQVDDTEAEILHIAKVSAQMNTRESLQDLEDVIQRKRRGANGLDSSPTNVQAFADHTSGVHFTTKVTVESGPCDRLNDEGQVNFTRGSGAASLLDKEGQLDSGLVSPLEIENSISDVEYGVYEQPDGLAVAFAVEDESVNDMFIPSAVEYDPDAKPPLLRNRRFRLYACLVIAMVLTGTVGTVVGILTRNKVEVPPPVIPFRERLGIRESVEQLVGRDQLDDPSNPYRKAFEWIQDHDSMQLKPQDKKFKQRFLAAYFYFGTSVKKPWAGACNPAQRGEKETCELEILVVVDPPEYHNVPSMRWLSSSDECAWAGIFCDESGSVRSLEFSGMNMTGSFPEGIVGFSFLQSLTISFSELYGTLPAELGDMKHLISVELHGNQLTGTIPDNWYTSRSVKRINLSLNQLSGPISPKIGQLSDLKGLFLLQNKFTGPLPSELGVLKSITDLRLFGNMFSGTIPTVIGHQQDLQSLWLQRNQFSGTIPTEIGLCTGLIDLRLQSNKQLRGTIPEELFRLTNLEQLDLFDNELTGTLSTQIGDLASLFTLRVENNKLEGTIPTELGLLSGLGSFSASGNNFAGFVPTDLCDLVAPSDQSVSAKLLTEVQLDCAVLPPDNFAEITCPTGCCTQCCDRNGANCYTMLDGYR